MGVVVMGVAVRIPGRRGFCPHLPPRAAVSMNSQIEGEVTDSPRGRSEKPVWGWRRPSCPWRPRMGRGQNGAVPILKTNWELETMPEAPVQPQIPDFRNRERYPERPSHHAQSYDSDFRALVAEVSRGEQSPEVPPKPFCDPKLSQPEYEAARADCLHRPTSKTNSRTGSARGWCGCDRTDQVARCSGARRARV